MKTIEVLTLILMGCVGCDPAANQQPKEPREPKVMQTSPIPSDGIVGLQVSPGWHEGKVYNLQQNLTPNPVVKGPLHVDYSSP
jgi:hypothetical protein